MKTINSADYNIHIGEDAFTALNQFLSDKKYSSVFILVDQNTKKRCLPLLKRSFTSLISLSLIQVKSGEKNKNILSCEKIWKELSRQNADRKSLLINLGGGVITDLGGFAASTYKRGIDFTNIPTTLLAQADASVGGKTGIDFSGFKNHIGTFSFPKEVFINPDLLKTLSKRELLSGFAEVIKHGLIADKSYWETVRDHKEIFTSNISDLISYSIEIKNKIVAADPYENGIRKALNFGHTIGHAVESASLKTKKPLLHGEAIAIGMICEAYLSRKYCGLSGEQLQEIVSYIISVFQPKKINHPVKKLIEFMKQDKKNNDSGINFTLLSSIGKAVINNSCTKELIEEAIYFFNSSCN
jgi:3-dehydroquinate synthase